MNLFKTPVLTGQRIAMAFAVAVAADGIQVLLGPLGWFPVDEMVDVAAMILITFLIGFHPLLLPTFAVEFFPVVDMLPTWTGCVALVVALRRKKSAAADTPPAVAHPPKIIDV